MWLNNQEQVATFNRFVVFLTTYVVIGTVSIEFNPYNPYHSTYRRNSNWFSKVKHLLNVALSFDGLAFTKLISFHKFMIWEYYHKTYIYSLPLSYISVVQTQPHINTY